MAANDAVTQGDEMLSPPLPSKPLFTGLAGVCAKWIDEMLVRDVVADQLEKLATKGWAEMRTPEHRYAVAQIDRALADLIGRAQRYRARINQNIRSEKWNKKLDGTPSKDKKVIPFAPAPDQ